MLEKGFIDSAHSAWGSLVVLVPKADASFRFCVDYRKLNYVTVRDTYVLPRMDECIDCLSDCTPYTTLDANSGYEQLHTAHNDREKMALVCHSGLYRFERIPFSLTSASATFQRALDMILGSYKWKTCLLYLDDVISFSKNMEDHLEDVELTPNQIQSSGLTRKLKNCKYFTDTVKYEGYMIKPGKRDMDKVATTAIRKATKPRTRTQLRAFLGLYNVYRRLFPRYSHEAALLHALV